MDEERKIKIEEEEEEMNYVKEGMRLGIGKG